MSIAGVRAHPSYIWKSGLEIEVGGANVCKLFAKNPVAEPTNRSPDIVQLLNSKNEANFASTEPYAVGTEVKTNPNSSFLTFQFNLATTLKKLVYAMLKYDTVPFASATIPDVYGEQILSDPRHPYYKFISDIWGAKVTTFGVHSNVSYQTTFSNSDRLNLAASMQRLASPFGLALSASSPTLRGLTNAKEYGFNGMPHTFRPLDFPQVPSELMVPLFATQDAQVQNHQTRLEVYLSQYASQIAEFGDKVKDYLPRLLWISARVNGHNRPNEIGWVENRIYDFTSPQMIDALHAFDRCLMQYWAQKMSDITLSDGLENSVENIQTIQRNLRRVATEGLESEFENPFDGILDGIFDGREQTHREALKTLLAQLETSIKQLKLEEEIQPIRDIADGKLQTVAEQKLELYKSESRFPVDIIGEIEQFFTEQWLQELERYIVKITKERYPLSDYWRQVREKLNWPQYFDFGTSVDGFNWTRFN